MNDLIIKLTQEARVMTNSERLKVSQSKLFEIVAGTKNRCGDLIHSSTHGISTTDIMHLMMAK
jgi:hypothetical protein